MALNRSDVLDEMRARGLIAVLRSPVGGDCVVDAVEALAEGGVTCAEITLTTPDAVAVIGEVAARYSRGEVLVGAGTVLTVEQCAAVVDAGAQYVVTPVVSVAVAAWCGERGVPVLMGAFTPTEVLAAHEAGADMVKIFPANSLGPGFLRALAGPFPNIPLVPTGGVDVDKVADYVRAGAVMIGCGGQLCPGNMIAEGDCDGLRDRARRFSEAFAAARG